MVLMVLMVLIVLIVKRVSNKLLISNLKDICKCEKAREKCGIVSLAFEVGEGQYFKAKRLCRLVVIRTQCRKYAFEIMFVSHAGVAQLAEQPSCNRQVEGSIPSGSSILIYNRGINYEYY